MRALSACRQPVDDCNIETLFVGALALDVCEVGKFRRHAAQARDRRFGIDAQRARELVPLADSDLLQPVFAADLHCRLDFRRSNSSWVMERDRIVPNSYFPALLENALEWLTGVGQDNLSQFLERGYEPAFKTIVLKAFDRLKKPNEQNKHRDVDPGVEPNNLR